MNQQDWLNAANQLRLPYWDWAKKIVPPDAVIDSPSVTIIDYDGQKIQVDNPLMRYKFQHPVPFTAPWNQYTETVRHPDADGNEDIAGLKRYDLVHQLFIEPLTNRAFFKHPCGCTRADH